MQTHLTRTALRRICVFAVCAAGAVCAQGIPEPGIVLYGKVWSPGGLLVEGSLTWRYASPGGAGAEVTVALQDIVTPTGEHYSYRASIPAQSAAAGYPVDDNVLPVTGAVVTYTRTAAVDGDGATIAGGRTTDTFSTGERGKLERVDLSVNGAAIPVGGIAGTVTYAGRQAGAVVVQVSLDPAFVGPLERQVTATATRGGTWLYSLPDLSAGAYYVRAFKDADGDGSPGLAEASGVSASNPAQLPPDALAVDIVLVDADSDHDSLPDWWETLRPGGLASGAGDDDDGDGAWNGLEYASGTDPDAEQSAPGPVAWWRLDESVGSVADDASGNLHVATLDNGPAWDQGIHEGALRFDGDDDRVTVPSAPDFDLTEGLTLQAWVRRQSPWTHDGRILCRLDDALETGYALGVRAADETLELRLSDGYRVQSAGTVPCGRWVHVAATFDAGAGTVRLYLDGRLDSTHARTQVCTASTLDLRIGAAAGGGRNSAGLIDDPKIYRYARSAEAIAADALAITVFAINDGATATRSRTVTLSNLCGGMPVEYIASEDAAFAGASWQPYAPAPTFTLSTGDGPKTVHLRVRSADDEVGPLSDTIALDTAAPAVTEVNATSPDGIYPEGTGIDLTVTFSEPVTVTATPQLSLETGGAGAAAAYLSGSGTTTLGFRYTVTAGDASAHLDCTSSLALGLNGGTVRDAAGNDADLTLPAPGMPHSLGANRNIAVGDVHTVAYGASAQGSVVGLTPQIVVHGGATSAVSAVPEACYTFVQWSDGATDNPRQDVDVTADVVVTAQFAEAVYTVIFLHGPGGTLSGDTSQTVGCGEDCGAVTAVPGPDYTFDRWSDGATDNPRTVRDVQANLTLTALFVTGAPPEGEFDLRFDSHDNPAARRMYDLTEDYSGALGVYTLTLDLTHDEKGTLSGSALLAGTMPAGAPVSIPLSLKGKATGSAGTVNAKITLTGKTPSSSAKLKLTLALDSGSLRGTYACSITDTVGGSDRISGECAFALPAEMDGTFALSVDLEPGTNATVAGTGTLTLSNGREVPLVVKGKTAAGVTMLQLTGNKSDDPLFGSVKFRLSTQTLSDRTGRILWLSGSGFGQKLAWP